MEAVLVFRGLCGMDLLICPGQGHRAPRALKSAESGIKTERLKA